MLDFVLNAMYDFFQHCMYYADFVMVCLYHT